jgi:hypothetical protein
VQVGEWDGTTFPWLDYDLNIDTALAAASQLFAAVRTALRSHIELRDARP